MEYLQDIATLNDINGIFLQVRAFENMEEFLCKLTFLNGESINNLVGGVENIDNINNYILQIKESIESHLEMAQILINNLKNAPPETVEKLQRNLSRNKNKVSLCNEFIILWVNALQEKIQNR
ncbi:hypothetical protein CEXT_419651 [Caerostris extrusa]|uniref:Uncharacterized protein n=1 Tax=Caerostris extrusa TaxID=172846 RepID=A0AAV4XQM3_CAEEX|nr:hypothetical protein CEXT_419651 [Caerostris extrusa]